MQLMCGGCEQPIEIDGVKPAQIVNTASVSVIVVEHPPQAFCARCQRPVAMFVTGCELIGIAAHVKPQEQKWDVLLLNRS